MKTYLSMLLFISFIVSGQSQENLISGQIQDKESGDILPFANIMIKGYSIGTTSDNNGIFRLNYSDTVKADTAVISFVGYETLEIPITEKSNVTIDLIQKSVDIAEVVVKPTKKTKTLTLNKFNHGDCMLRYSISPFDTSGNFHIPYRPEEPSIEAIYFPFESQNSKYKRIKDIKLRVKSITDTSTFRLRIFLGTPEGGPADDLLFKSNIIKVNMNQSDVTIDLSNENILMPESGIYIGFELLIIPENLTIMSNNEGKEAFVYSPFLYQININKKYDTWYYSKGKWSLSKYWYFKQGIWFESEYLKLTDKKTAGPYKFRPAISLILSE